MRCDCDRYRRIYEVGLQPGGIDRIWLDGADAATMTDWLVIEAKPEPTRFEAVTYRPWSSKRLA